MARSFVRASSQYIWANSNLGITGTPLTLACWFRTPNITDRQTLISINKYEEAIAGDAPIFSLDAMGDTGGDPIRALAWNGAAGGQALTTSNYTANIWHHACAVFASSTSRTAYLNGGSSTTNTTNITPSGINRVHIGALVRQLSGITNAHDGRIAEVGVWNAALTAAQVLQLARGISPLSVAPESLVAYVPLWGEDPEVAPVGGLTWTLVNGPVKSDHAPVFYIPAPHVISADSIAGELRVTQAGFITELESGDGQLLVTQSGMIVELGASELRVTQAGLIIELEEEPELPTYQIRRTGGRAVHMRLPESVTGYAFDPAHSWWSVVVPEETENWIENPSFEQATTGYSPSSWASSARVTGDAIGATRGATAMRITNTASTQATLAYTVASVPAGAWTWSLDVYVPRTDVTLILRTNYSSTTYDKTVTFTRTGWQRIEVTRVSLATSNWQLTLVSPDTNTVSVAFRTDGWQFENKKYSTTYADGDMLGWYDVQANQSYYWTGVPHDSKSVRRARTGTGGRIVYFSDLIEGIDFNTTAIVGAGMAPVEMDTVRVGYERELHRGVRILPRDFTITGKVIACSYESLYQGRNRLIDLLRPTRTPARDPLILRYQVTDDVGREASLPLEIVCAYSDGLRGNINDIYQETIGLQFHASVPYWTEEFDSAADLGTTPYESLTSNRIIYRDGDGIYQNLGTGATNERVRALKFDADGVPLAGGTFTTICGDAVSYFAQWNGSNWVSLGDGDPNDTVNVIDVIPETNVFIIGGEFTIVGGAICDRIAYLDGAFWASVTTVETGFSSGEVEDLVYDRYSGQIFEVGGGNGSGFAYYAAIGDSAWTAIPSGGLSSLETVLSTHDGYIWFGGSFTQSGDASLTLNRVARYNIEENELEALGAGFSGTVQKLIQGADGFVYAFGGFLRDGNDNYDLRGAARWNGSSWEEIPITRSTAAVPEIVAVDNNGIFWYADLSDAFASPNYGSQHLLGWSSGVEYPQPFLHPADASGISALAFGPNNEMLVGILLSSATATYAPKQFTVEVGGDAEALPVFVLRNKQTPKLIQNLDAETGIYFRDDFRVVDNERLFVNLAGVRPRFYTDTRVNLTKHIYTGASNIGSFTLRPGTNRIMLFCVEDDGAVTVRNSLIYKNRFLSSDAVQTL